jgi:hypothetical protein
MTIEQAISWPVSMESLANGRFGNEDCRNCVNDIVFIVAMTFGLSRKDRRGIENDFRVV